MLTPFNYVPRHFLGLTLAVVLAVGLSAQQPVREYSPSDKTSEVLIKYKEAMDQKPTPNYATALSLINSQLTQVPADSYDAALIYQYQMQVYLQQGEFTKSIAPMERSLELSEAKTPTFFDERITRELYFFLVQLYFQEGAQTKNTTLSASYFDKAQKAMEHWLRITPQTNADAQLIYVQLLVSRALINPSNPDRTLITKALEQIEIGLKLATRPKDNFFIFKLICMQQLERNEEAAELLELMVKIKPDSSTYWNQLFATYVNNAGNLDVTKNPQAVQSNYIRSIVAMERAQALGHLNSVKDNQNLLSIYFNIGQYEKSAELLETGLKTGRIESDLKNWQLLSLCYQQLERPLKGIEALKQATKAFPDSGQLELLVGQAYTALDKPNEALPHYQTAIKKGNIDKPYQAYLALAYSAYSLKQFEVALEAARKAATYPDGAKDGENMANSLEALIKDREAKKNKT